MPGYLQIPGQGGGGEGPRLGVVLLHIPIGLEPAVGVSPAIRLPRRGAVIHPVQVSALLLRPGSAEPAIVRRLDRSRRSRLEVEPLEAPTGERPGVGPTPFLARR